MGPLTGIRVVDVSRLLPGPFCSWYLASLGAEVVRVDPPSGGDYSRTLPPVVDGVGVFYACIHRGKRSVSLDLRNPASHAAFHALLASADVLLEGFKPGTLTRSGLAPEVLLEQHPSMLVASITGYGQRGPLAKEPGHDLNYQGFAGVVAAAADERPYPVQVADVAGGALTAALSICAALVGRERGTLTERWLDISMAAGVLGMMAPHLAMATAEGRTLRPGGEMLTGALPNYRAYRCADGRWLCVGALEPKFLETLIAQAGAPPSVDLFRTRARDEWVQLLQGCCVSAALEPEEVAAHPHFAPRFEQVFGIPMARAPFPWATSSAVATPGEHTRAVLEPLGVDVQSLIDVGVSA